MDNRAWIVCTKWTGNDAYLLAKEAVKQLKGFGYDVTLDNTRRTGSGSTKLLSNNFLECKVGIKELIENPYTRFSIHEALAPTVTCFHEVCGHGGQWRNEAKKNTILSKVLLLNDLAGKASLEYYGIDSSYENPLPRYFEQPHEIATQYMALKMSQKFLSAVYDKETADKLLCEYVNLRIASDNEFVKVPDDYRMEIPLDGRKPYMKPTEPFSSMNQIYDQFQKTFIEQVFKPVDYKVTKNSMDFVETYIEQEKWPWDRMRSRHQINQISDRLTQAYVLAGTWLDQHPYGRWVSDLPVFKDMGFPKGIPKLIRNAPDQPAENDLDLELLTEESIDFDRAVKELDNHDNQTL